MTTATCRGCVHLKVQPDKDGKVRVRKERAYRCGAQLQSLDDLKLPASVIVGGYGLKWPPYIAHMEPDRPHDRSCPHRSEVK